MRQYLSRQSAGFRGINALLAILCPSLALAAPVNAVAASLTTSLTGANNDLVFTAATKGTVGNATTVAYVNPGTPSAALSVSVTGTAITVNLATGAGTAQVETATVTAASGATSSGNLSVTVVSTLLASPTTVLVALVTGTHTTATLIATAIKDALNATPAIAAKFTATSSAATVILTVKVAYVAANDATFNVAIAAGLGVSAAASSADTTAGVAPAITSTSAQIKAAIEASTAASALVTVTHSGSDTGAGVVIALTATALSAGTNGTAGEPWEQRWHSGSLYINASDTAKGTATDNWYRQTFTLVA
jgi:hypothetical protein